MLIYKLLLLVGIFAIVFVLSGLLIEEISGYKERLVRKIKEERTPSRKELFIRTLLFSSRTELARSIKLLSAVIMTTFIFLFTGKFFIGLIFGILGLFLPKVIAKILYNKKIDKFNKQLIEGLSSIANSLRAGSSFQQALEVLIRESSPPISEEFAQVTHEVRLGVPVAEALDNLTKRVDSKELHISVTAINIAREAGGRLAEILNNIASTMRERNKLQGKIKALTAQGRMSGIIVGSLPILLAFVLYFMDPEMMRPMFTTPIGYILIGLVVLMLAIGAFIIKKIITIDI
jgi:tight adherence protein B